MKRTTILLSFLMLFGVFDGKAQAGFTPDSTTNYFDQRNFWDAYYDSIVQYNTANGITGEIEGYSAYVRWREYWNSYMPSSGSYEEALEIIQMSKNYREHVLFDSYPDTSAPNALNFPTPTWVELGPKNMTKIKTKKNGTWYDSHINNNGQNPPWDNNNGQLKSAAHVAKIDRLYQHPVNPNTIYACAGGLENGGGGVFVSHNLGQSWSLLGKYNASDLGTDQIPNPDIATFAVKPSQMDPDIGTEYFFIGLSTGAVYRSNDNGLTWIECTYYGINNFPFILPYNAGERPNDSSLFYQNAFNNFAWTRVEKNNDLKFTKANASSNEFSRLIVAQHGAIFASDNHGASLSYNNATDQIENEIIWDNLTDGIGDNFNTIKASIPNFGLSQWVIKDTLYHFNDFEWVIKNGATRYFAQFQVAIIGEAGDNDDYIDIDTLGNIRQYVIYSDDYGVTWDFLGDPNDPNGPFAEEVMVKNFSEGNIEVLRYDPTYLYVASPDINSTHSLRRFNLDNPVLGWGDQYLGPLNSPVGTKPHGFAIDPTDDEDWWFFCNDVQIMSGGSFSYFPYSVDNTTYQSPVPTYYSTFQHADPRDLLVLPTGELILGTDGGVYQSRKGLKSHITNATSEGMNAAQSQHVGLSQYPPFYVTSGFWHCGLQVYNPETDEWHHGDMKDGTVGHIFFLNNERFVTGNQWSAFSIAMDYDQLEVVPSIYNIGIIASSENLSGRSYGVQRNGNIETLFYNNDDFISTSTPINLTGINFVKNTAVPYVIPNEPDKVVVKEADTMIHFYNGCSSSTPSPVLDHTVDANFEYQTLGGTYGEAFVGDIVFDPRRNGDYYMVLKKNPTYDPLTKRGRIVKYDAALDYFIDLSHPTDDDFNSSAQDFPYWLEISALTLDRQTGILYMATVNGVYYLDESNEKWRKYSKNVPLLETDIDIRHCTGEIFASSLNRGIWHTDLIRGERAETLEWKIEQSQIWNERMNLFCTLVIEPGAVLTVADELVVYGDQKIIVKPGAKLIVDGGTITSECGDYWKGIEVVGDYTKPQDPQFQGHLITQNGAKIEYAKEAIATWEVGNYATTGGIVHCTNTQFVNNRTSAYFYPYQYLSSGIETLNTGFFVNCEFLWDDNYIDQHPMVGVILNNVNGVTIKGSDFIDSRASLVTGDTRPKGIFSLDAGYKVIARNTTLGTLPVHEVFDPTGGYDVNNFKNLEYGIYSLGANSARTITADHCKFENVMYGINLSAVDNAVLTRNLVEYNSSHPTDIGLSFGIELSESTGYTVQGNTFTNTDVDAFTGGVFTWDTGSDDNFIRLNYYNDQFFGNYARGINSNTVPGIPIQSATGLTWLCNDLENSKYDLSNYAEVGVTGGGVKIFQGNDEESTGNKFTDVGYLSLNAHILHTDDDLLEYYAYDGDPQQNPTVLDGFIQVNLQGVENFCESIFQEIIVEESRMMSSSSESQLSTEVVELDQEIQTNKAELQLNLLNGDNAQLHQMVATITPSNKHIVRDSLYAASPYLSQQLLEELGEKPVNCFSHVWYTALIQANIEVARSDAFMSYLETKTNPLPQGLFNQIDSMRFVHFTERGQKEMEINRLSSKRHNKANLLLVNELSDSSVVDWNEVQQKMIQRNNKVCRAELSDQFLGRGNVAACLALLDSIDQNLADYTLEHEYLEMQDFSTFKRYVLNITNNTGIVEALDETQIQELTTMADQFTGRAAIQARNLLCFHAGLCENREVLLPPNAMQIFSTEPGGLSAVEAQTPGVSAVELRVIPNPNKGEFVLEVPKECSIKQLNIVDIIGKEVPFENLEQIENTNRILILNKETGILFLKAQCDDGSVYSTRIVVNK